MNARDLRQKFLEFFEAKGHLRHPSGSLVPYDVTGRLDESLLFNGAGMVQFKPYFRGVAQPPSKRLTNVQKCVRTGDIEEIGDLTHLSFFEMMGNFSFGDYFKKDAIAYSWEFMTSPEWLGLDPRRLSFTVHDEDDESFELWSDIVGQVGLVGANRVFRLDEETNFWPAGSFTKGPPGPCGPNSEMFYWTPNDEPPPSNPNYSVEDWKRDEAAGKWLEIWNDVFIQYEWKGHLADPSNPSKGWVKEGLDPLPFQSVDTGMGVERTSTALCGFRSVYQIDVFEPVFRVLQGIVSGSPSSRLTGEGRGGGGAEGRQPIPGAKRGEGAAEKLADHPLPGLPRQGGGAPPAQEWALSDTPQARAARIIADHARTACFCIADGILPGNTGRGYVLRRLIRRAVLKGQRVLGIGEPFLWRVYEGVAAALGGHYTELVERREVIVETLRSEEELFRRTLNAGFGQFRMAMIEPGLFELQSQILEVALKSGYPEVHDHQEGSYEPPEVILKGPVKDELRDRIRNFGELVGQNRDFDETMSIMREGTLIARALDDRTTRPIRVRLSGEDAFQLYDTYGFPLEVTQELCEEAGIEVDLEGFEAAMKEAQERSRAAHWMESVYGGVGVRFEFLVRGPGSDRSDKSDSTDHATPTRFVGYDTLECEATIVGAMVVEESSPGRDAPDASGRDDRAPEQSAPMLAVALDQTPFYAESGGEVSDTGTIEGQGFTLEVLDLIKQDGVYVHMTRPSENLEGKSQDEINDMFFGQRVTARVDKERRRSITRNHTATHLLHSALRTVLGKHVTQAGSLVAPDHLRFDFTHGKSLTDEELDRVEGIVNGEILDNRPVAIHNDVPIEQAKKMGAMALFGEKYGDTVRMVEVPGFSLELCGGCHVRSTAEIGLFKILHESSAASGVRRIEAVTGQGAYRWAKNLEGKIEEAASRLKTNPNELVSAIEKLQEQLREEKRRLERMRTQTAAASEDEIEKLGEIELARKSLEEGDMKEATLIVDRLVEGNPKRVAFVALKSDGKVQLVCKAGAEAVKAGAHAGNLVKEAAQIVGGGGGGRPDFATAGGRDPSKIGEALDRVRELIAVL